MPQNSGIYVVCWGIIIPLNPFICQKWPFLDHFRAENGQKMAKSYFFTHWPNPSPDAPTLSRDQVIRMQNKKMGVKKAS